MNDFLHVGGDPKWLNGLENAPQKLQNLGELNKMLAHRPWLITKEHIEVNLSWGNVNPPLLFSEAVRDSWSGRCSVLLASISALDHCGTAWHSITCALAKLTSLK